ncbi:MAG: lycopene cyclase domain-containing protein [Anaerolineae bacterium]|nr:lycopene cyclase domain-containing protein [Anaerolineae bacterium]
MTYFGFLAVFLCIPIALLWALSVFDARRGLKLPLTWKSWPVWIIILSQALVAVIYTTPWDNYLVATKVWWYSTGLVTGLVIGYVPIEEYTFFVLQTILTAAWLLFLVRHRPLWTSARMVNGSRIRRWTTAVLAVVWLIFVGILIKGWQPGTYLALLMVWALPPVMLQTGFGADILWENRRFILLTVIPMTLYLALADKLAISSGTWTINPAQSLNIFVLGTLPVEEFIFFFMTNLLVAVGVTLLSSTASKQRVDDLIQAIKHRRKIDHKYETSS